jgi:hypothetical protein
MILAQPYRPGGDLVRFAWPVQFTSSQKSKDDGLRALTWMQSEPTIGVPEGEDACGSGLVAPSRAARCW